MCMPSHEGRGMVGGHHTYSSLYYVCMHAWPSRASYAQCLWMLRVQTAYGLSYSDMRPGQLHSCSLCQSLSSHGNVCIA